MTAVPMAAGDQLAPALPRRLACFLYEAVLLFGVWWGAGLVYALVTQQHHALVGRYGLEAVLFVVFGAYFAWFWTHGGQTLPMQTWHIRLVMQNGRPLSLWRATARYVCAYLWFMPALISVSAAGLTSRPGVVVSALVANVLAYAALSRLHPQRQYWHDVVCGTRLVNWQNKARP